MWKIQHRRSKRRKRQSWSRSCVSCPTCSLKMKSWLQRKLSTEQLNRPPCSVKRGLSCNQSSVIDSYSNRQATLLYQSHPASESSTDAHPSCQCRCNRKSIPFRPVLWCDWHAWGAASDSSSLDPPYIISALNTCTMNVKWIAVISLRIFFKPS